MSDTALANTQAEINGKTVLTAEDAAVVSGGLTPSADSVPVGILRRATVTLTDAQIKALPTTGVQVIAAPPAGYWNHVVSASFHADVSAGAYTNIDTTYSALSLVTAAGNWLVSGIVNDSVTVPALTRMTSFLGGTLNSIIFTTSYLESFNNGWVLPAAEALVSDFNASAVRVAVDNNGAGNFTGGNAANTLKITAYYIVEAL